MLLAVANAEDLSSPWNKAQMTVSIPTAASERSMVAIIRGSGSVLEIKEKLVRRKMLAVNEVHTRWIGVF